MSLWNPYAFTPTGERTPIAAPPSLRVMGSATITKDQLFMAQHAFAAFCGRSRVSFWQNPNEQGCLADGTPYRITVVGNSTVMQIWPAPPVTKHRSGGGGVAITAIYGGEATLYLVTFINGDWRIEQRDVLYGGYGLWKPHGDGMYFTDYTAYPSMGQQGGAGGMNWALKHVADEHSLIGSASDTTTHKGLAYQVPLNGLFLGIPHNEKFTSIRYRSPRAVEIYEAPLVSDAEVANTPDVFAGQSLQKIADLEFVSGRSLDYADMNYATLGLRLRDATAVEFAVRDSLHPVTEGPSMSRNKWVSDMALTHQAVVHIGDGSYSLQLRPHAAVSNLLRNPDLDNRINLNGAVEIPWNFRMKRDAEIKRMPAEIMVDATYSYINGDPSQSVSEVLQVSAGYVNGLVGYTEQRLYKNQRSGNYPVYVGRDWADEKVAFAVQVSEERQYQVETEGEYVFNTSNAVWNPSAPLITYDPRSTRNPAIPGSDGWTLYNGYQWGHAAGEDASAYTNAMVPPGAIYTDDAAYTLKNLRTLQTPWGNVPLTDIDATVKSQYVRKSGIYTSGDGDEVSHTITGIIGRARHRDIVFISPVLGVVGFFEITVTAWSVVGEIIKPTEFFSEISLMHKGVEFYRQGVPSDSVINDGRSIHLDASTSRPAGHAAIPSNAVRQKQATALNPSFYAVLESNGDSNTQRIFAVDSEANPDTGSIPLASEDIYSQTVGFQTKDIPIPSLPIYYVTGLVYAAIDPNSGGGVLSVVDPAINKSAASWLLSPTGQLSPLLATLRERLDGKADSITHWMVSV